MNLAVLTLPMCVDLDRNGLISLSSSLSILDLWFYYFCDGSQFPAKILQVHIYQTLMHYIIIFLSVCLPVCPSVPVQGNCTLSCLRLSGNKIGDSGAMLLAMMLQGNDSLMELELSACDLVHTHRRTQTFTNTLMLPTLMCKPPGHTECHHVCQRVEK